MRCPSRGRCGRNNGINVEAAIGLRDGTAFHGQISAAPVQSSSGVKLSVAVVYHDISARKELERVREEFAAIVAHDLRTPLQSVLIQIDILLAQATGTPDGIRDHAPDHEEERIPPRAAHPRSPEASRIDAHRIVLDRRAAALPELVSTLVTQIQGALGTHQISVAVVGEPPLVSVDPIRIDQILTNLLENRASSRGRARHGIVVAAVEGGAMLAVEDRGPGIAPEEFPHLFDRFYQTRKARDGKRGLGLGLFITRGLVEAHGGRITVESTPGTGSTFRVWLPATRS